MIIRNGESSDGVTLEMTPMIDVVFLLLTFFLVATTFRQAEREMQIALPVAGASEPISSALRELIVNVDAEGRIFVGGRSVEAEEFGAIVTEAVGRNPEQKVTLRGDRSTAYANIVRVLDICKGSGVQEPFLDTVLE